MNRPQFLLPDPPAGWVWQPCIYQFDRTNTPAFNSVVLGTGQESGHIPLHLDKDACFLLLACKITASAFNVLLFDPWSNQMMDDFTPGELYASSIPPATVLEGPGIDVPAGAVFTVRIQGR